MSKRPTEFQLQLQKAQCVRDLKWVVESPSLIDTDRVNCLEFSNASTQMFDGDQLVDYLRSTLRSYRVGDYFEALVLYAVRHHLDGKILYSHHQVFEGTKTIGEVDCVFVDADGRCVHLEVAFKVFLAVTQRGAFERISRDDDFHPDMRLIGPNPADSLHGKLQRICDFQLPMSDRLGVRIDEKRVLIRGRIHYRASDRHSLESSPVPAIALTREELSGTSLAQDHLTGWWIYQDELERLEALGADTRFARVEKPFWLSTIDCRERNGTCDLGTLAKCVEQHFDRQHSAFLFSIMSPEDSVSPSMDQTQSGIETYTETGRCFVVPSIWPAIESPPNASNRNEE